MKLKILELFGGIGACTKALKNLGIEYEIADYVEIDKYCVASYNAMNGTNFEPQDITDWNKDIAVDLIMHGSPCQDFSLAGKQAGGDEGSGTRSSLMYETIRIVEKLKPKYVIWENVKNVISKKHKHNFDNYIERLNQAGYRSYYQVLNAKDYGIPQNRERVFTISIRKDIDKGYKFPEKEPLKLRLKDMLEEQVDEKYYLNDAQVERIKTTSFVSGGEKARVQNSEVCGTLLARDYKDPKCVQAGILKGEKWEKMQDISRRVYSEEGISPSIHTCQGGNTEPKVEQEVSNTKNDGGHYTENSIRKIQQNIRDKEDIASTITANAMQSFNHDNCQLIKVGDNEKEITKFPSIIQKCGDRGNNNYSVSDISYTIPSNPMSDRGQLLIEEEPKVKKAGYIDNGTGEHQSNQVYDFTGLSSTICAADAIKCPPKVLIKNATKKGYLVAEDGDGVDISSRMQYHRGTVQKQIIQTIDTHCTHGVVLDESKSAYTRDYGSKGKIQNEEETADTLQAAMGEGGGNVPLVKEQPQNLRIRKLTPKECWRLMGFDDEDFEKAEKVNSNTQLYKQAGNSIVVKTLEKILSNLLEDKTNE